MFLLRPLTSFQELVLLVCFLPVEDYSECGYESEILLISSSEWIQMKKLHVPDQDSWCTRPLAM